MDGNTKITLHEVKTSTNTSMNLFTYCYHHATAKKVLCMIRGRDGTTTTSNLPAVGEYSVVLTLRETNYVGGFEVFTPFVADGTDASGTDNISTVLDIGQTDAADKAVFSVESISNFQSAKLTVTSGKNSSSITYESATSENDAKAFEGTNDTLKSILHKCTVTADTTTTIQCEFTSATDSNNNNTPLARPGEVYEVQLDVTAGTTGNATTKKYLGSFIVVDSARPVAARVMAPLLAHNKTENNTTEYYIIQPDNYAVTLGTVSTSNNNKDITVPIKVTADKVPLHTAGGAGQGNWVGVGIPSALGAGLKGKYDVYVCQGWNCTETNGAGTGTGNSSFVLSAREENEKNTVSEFKEV